MELYTVRKELNLGKTLSDLNLRVTYYSRVSTDNVEQKKSLRNQIEHFDEYIKSNKNWIYIKGYIDQGISGTTDFKRDNFMKMISDAKKGEFDLIITKEISRFSRNTLDSIKYTRELLSYGVAVFFVNDNINTILADSELRLTIMASMAQDEIRRLSERVKFGMNRAIINGEILGNNMLYGYRKNKETRKLEIKNEEYEVVKRLYNMYAINNYSLCEIARIFNKESIKTSRNKKWCASSLSRMISNPKYKGYYCGKKTEVEDYMTKKVKYIEESKWIKYEDKEKIPPIVDEALWKRANDRLKTRKKTFGKDYKDKKIYKDRYIYSAKIYCANDNFTFHRRKQIKNGDDITWICSKYLTDGKASCNSSNIREKELNTIIMDTIKTFQINLSKISLILRKLYKNNNTVYAIEEKANRLEKSLSKLLEKKEKILELNIENYLSNEEFKQKNEELNNKIRKIEKHLVILNLKKNNSGTKDKLKRLNTIINKKLNQENVKNKLISLIINKIIVSKLKNNSIKLEIYLNFKENFFTSYKKTYSFNRGYNTKCTKRYTVKYIVACKNIKNVS